MQFVIQTDRHLHLLQVPTLHPPVLYQQRHANGDVKSGEWRLATTDAQTLFPVNAEGTVWD